MKNGADESPIKFPCHFTIKVVGKSSRTFENKIFKIVQTIFPDFSKKNYKKRLSRDANYLALSITVYVLNKEQLDTVYQALSHTPEALFVL